MPNDYTSIAAEHARKAGGVPYTTDVEKGTYTLYPKGIDWPVHAEEYWPTETAGQPDVRSISQYVRPEEWRSGHGNIEDLPEQDYELGRLTIKRQYSDDVKIADGYQPGSPQYIALHEEARMSMQSRLAKLQMDYDRANMQFKNIRQNPNLDPDEQFMMKSQYYESNPVWKPERIGYPKSTAIRDIYTAGRVQSALGQLATDEETIYDRESAEAAAARLLGIDYAQNYQEAVDIINQREAIDFNPLPLPFQPTEAPLLRGEQVPEEYRRMGITEYRPSTMEDYESIAGERPIITPARKGGRPTPEQIAEYQRLGGGQTAEGRRYRNEIMESLEPPMKAPMPAAQPAALPPKPIGYPDAVWNEQARMWTIIKNGRLIGLSEE
jgi:hypothetical protein